MTKLLAQELGKSNPQVNISMSDVEKIKEQFSCCAEDELAYAKTQNVAPEKHILPDGQVCISQFPNFTCMYRGSFILFDILIIQLVLLFSWAFMN